MNKLYKVEETVKEILKEVPAARDDDFILLAHVYYKLDPEIVGTPFNVVMLGHKEYGLPPFESVTRARRKLQAEYEELRANKKVEDARLNKLSDYINYAIDGYNPTFMKMVDFME